jgi:aminopeptidase N
MRIMFIILFLGFLFPGKGQDQIDVLHYRYEIELSDKSDTIYGKAAVTVKFLSAASSVILELGMQNEQGKGMFVDKVTGPNLSSIDRRDDKIIINIKPGMKAGDTATFFVPYHGAPSDGLVISINKFGNRTFFSDNWPNRAHQWIPCKDDPADKASVEFIITAPLHYQVVANGIQQEETNISSEKKLTHWKEDVPLPTKVMAIGVADFAVNLAGIINGVDVTSWVYPEEREKGFFDYGQATEILSFLSNYIGPYPYKKLANVQARTVFGGMENANTIFYSEASVTGTRENEALLAHEITHQWFGNMATEKQYAHIWLSEGFATYLTHIYLESKYGTERLISGLREDRKQVIEFAKNSTKPVVDHSSSPIQLLNTNSYQKGGWVLHMLRRQLGDTVFKKVIRSYYDQFKGKNADSRDFQTVAEQVSKKNLKQFFDQWLYKAGLPELKIQWKYDAKGKNIAITIMQQGDIFIFPFQVSVQDPNGQNKLVSYSITKRAETFKLPVKTKPAKLIADPAVSLLFEGTVEEIK